MRLFVQPVYIFLKRCRFLFQIFFLQVKLLLLRVPPALPFRNVVDQVALVFPVFDDERGMVFDEKQFPVDVLQLPRYLLEAFRISPLRMELLLHLRLVFRLLRADAPLFIFVLLFDRLREPLLFTGDERVPRNDLEMINPEVTRTVAHYFPEHRRTALYQCGPLFAAAEVNFEVDGIPQRLWVCAKAEIPQFAEAVPRDTALALGPLPLEQFSEQLLAAASNPDETLSGWSPLQPGRWNLPYIVRIPKKEKELVAVALTFRADAVIDSWKLHVPKNNVKGVFLNGKKIENQQLPTPIVTRKGLNRVVVLYDASRGGDQMISVTKGTNPNLPVEFVRE